mmetsp:Transcript_16668/g.25698  ORF Transcript_16668/g.25698 Transcript_16668/m.25698 type:complete len:97 (+) Transcript_16668:348-638(+)
MTQLIGMGLSIFHFSSWDVVEPITWIVQAFWLSVGSSYYLSQKSDFEYTNAFDHFQKRKMNELLYYANFDLQKKEFLQDLIQEFEVYFACLDIPQE